MSTPTPPYPRRSDLDALRAVAMLLGIAVHASLSFFPSMWVVRDTRPDPAFGVLFSALHGFRMPVFFVMSGFFSAMMLRRRGPAAMVRHRFRRVFLPMLLGLATVVPLTNWISAVAMSSAAATPAATVATEGEETLGDAAAAGDLAAIERLLATGAKVGEIGGDFGLTPLHRAAVANQAKAAGLLILRGADPNAAAIDAATTLYFASFLKLPVEEKGLESRKAEVAETLRANGATPGRQSGLADLLMEIPIFGHLWFLWFLWWLALGLAVISPVAARLPGVRLPAWLAASPARYLWLIPLTMVPQWFMGDSGASPIFGPDTSTGLLPIPHVLAFYAVFFGFGAIDHARDPDGRDDDGRWWPPLAIGLLVVFPLGMALATGWPGPLAEALSGLDPAARRLLSVGLQAAYPWLMTFGLMGLFRRVGASASPTMRYLSDSAYWLYLAHPPLVIAAQHATRELPLPAAVKFALIVAGSTAFLLLTYRAMVRHTWIGRMLNGPRSGAG